MNPILNLIHGNQNGSQNSSPLGGVNGILGMFNAFKNSNNQEEMLKSMAQSNPQMQQVLNMINNQYNGDAQAAFYAKAKELGIDPNQVLGLFK